MRLFDIFILFFCGFPYKRGCGSGWVLPGYRFYLFFKDPDPNFEKKSDRKIHRFLYFFRLESQYYYFLIESYKKSSNLEGF